MSASMTAAQCAAAFSTMIAGVALEERARFILLVVKDEQMALACHGCRKEGVAEALLEAAKGFRDDPRTVDLPPPMRG